jgi:flagellar hook-length control protein FliK
MANTTVTKVSEMMLTNVTAGVKAGEQKVSDAEGFGAAMKDAKDTTAKAQEIQPENGAKSSRTVVESPKSKEIKTEDTVKKDPIANKDDREMFTEEVAEETSMIMNKIKEVLGISDEELETAMETLGITAVDLLNPTNIKELCMELGDVPDSISLITNADLYENVKEIVNFAESAGNKIAADFGMTNEGVSELLLEDETFIQEVNEAVTKLENKDLADVFEATETVLAPEQNIQNIETPKPDMDVDRSATTVADIKDTNVTEGTEAKTVTVTVTGKPEEAPQTGEREVTADNPAARQGESVTESFKATVKSEESNLKGNNEGFEHASRFAETENTVAAPTQTVVTTEVNNLGQVVETVRSYSNADANSIMSQVTQSIRVNYSADVTSMEMQLHPASLGTVNMNIASTNGVVTAHILVENEAVKAALESQLITLQQTFEEQGQRVEAVEVSVANYDLNKGTGSDSEGNTDRERTSGAGRSGRRRSINLNDLEEEDIEELSDEEKISADMMARSGNSVDYTA